MQLQSSALRYGFALRHDCMTAAIRPANLPDRRTATSPDEPHSGRDGRVQRLESVLFLAREPLSSRKLSQFANLADATEARTLVRRLNEMYDHGGRAFRVEEVAGGYQLLTRPRFAGWLRRLKNVPNEVRLSGPALETLAVVAYRQPTGRAEVEAIRGVACGEILRQLMERDLVRISGRSEELGRPYLYATTRRFLQLFGLKSLDKLPRVAEMQKILQDAEREASSTNAGTNEEENNVAVTTVTEWSVEETTEEFVVPPGAEAPANSIDDDDYDDLDDDDDDDEFDDDDDFADDDFGDDEEDEESDDEDEEYDGDDWEEVDGDDDDDDDWDDDDEEDLGWNDSDDDDDDDDWE